MKIAILGSGFGSNCQAIIDAVESNTLNVEIMCIISDVKDAYILKRAKKYNIKSFYVDCSPYRTVLKDNPEEKVINILKENNCELIVLAGFMRILKNKIINTFPNKIINIHPSLLPLFPGLEAGKQALDAGVSETGCTVHYVDEGIDSGKIIIQEKVIIEPNDNLETLMIKIHKAEHIAYPKAIQKLL